MADEKGTSQSTGSPPATSPWLEYIRGSVFKYIIVAVLPSLAFIAMMLYISPCFSLLILPLVAVVLFWLFKIKKLWHQVALGAVALLIASVLMAAVYMTAYTEVPGGLYSDDGALVDGIVTPFSGPPGTNFTFTVTVMHNASNVDARVVIFDLYGVNILNLTMNLESHSADNSTRNYSTSKILQNPVNGFIFDVNIDGKWHESIWSNGPISSDSLAVYGMLLWAWLMQIFAYCFMQFIVMLLFLRMSGKSKETREKMLMDYKKKKEEALSRSKASKEGQAESAEVEGKDDVFVCSECGSEVKSTAKYCPNCGEPFDDDEDEKPKSEPEKK